MKIRIVNAPNRYNRPFLIEVDGLDDGKWLPFGNHPNKEEAERTVSLMTEMYGAVDVTEESAS